MKWGEVDQRVQASRHKINKHSMMFIPTNTVYIYLLRE